MRKKLIIIIVAVAAIVGPIVWRASKPSEPVYKGKRLSLWLKNNLPSGDAREAVLHVGTNAIPTLLRLLRTKDSVVDTPYIWLSRRQALTFRYHPTYVWHYEAAAAFVWLGTNAQAAAPELIKIADENISYSSRLSAIESLAHVGSPTKETLSTLARWNTDSNAFVRSWAQTGITRIAMRLANDKASTLYHSQPFLYSGPPVNFVEGRWVWIGRQRLGQADIQATVEIAADGSTNNVSFQIFNTSTDALR